MNKVNQNMKNSQYTQEFRDSTIQLVMNSEKSVLQIAKDLDVNPKTIYNWVRVYKKANNIPIDSVGKSSVSCSSNIIKETQLDELKRLRAENKLLKQERDILKKATAYFAKGVL
jgi:transposase